MVLLRKLPIQKAEQLKKNKWIIAYSKENYNEAE
jgi:hypothetical protein